MEATRAVEGLLDKIRPPRLEDAGLEDCALPPESIKEAFLKAASTVGSRAASIFSTSDDESEDEGRCVSDLRPNEGESSDTPVRIKECVDPPPGASAAEMGGGVPEFQGGENVTDEEEREEEGCVDGLRGLKIGDKKG